MHKDARQFVSHEDMLFTLAVAVGKASKQDDPLKAAEAALMLAQLVTEEDITKTKGILKYTMEQCGCERCLKALAKIAKIEAQSPPSDESFAV